MIKMGCTKAQVLALLDFILNTIRESRDKEEAYKRILELRIKLQAGAWEELERELFG